MNPGTGDWSDIAYWFKQHHPHCWLFGCEIVASYCGSGWCYFCTRNAGSHLVGSLWRRIAAAIEARGKE